MSIRFLITTIGLSVFATSANTDKPVLQYLMVGAKRVPFETDGRATPFANVAKILGGKAEAKKYGMDTPTICYRLAGPAPQVILIFFGDDMGSNALTEFEVAPASTKPELKGKCGLLSVTAAQIATDRGVRLGLSRVQVDSKLGQADRADGENATYEATEERIGKNENGGPAPYRLTSSLTVTYRNGKVVGFSGGISDED